MLVLTRRPGEAVWIGDEMTIIVLAVKGNQVRIGFEVPQQFEINREEVGLRKWAEKHPGLEPPRMRWQRALDRGG
jgi:carbon storage regulator